jgi:predicted transcriptional regulator
MAKTKGAVSLIGPELAKAKTLAAMGHSYRQIGRELGKSDHTIKRALTASPEVVAEVETMQKDLGGIFDDLAKRMAGSITDEDIKKLNAYQRTVSAAIATDKAQLLKGQPTMNVGVLVQVLDVIREQQDAEDEAATRKWREEHGLPAPRLSSHPAAD